MCVCVCVYSAKAFSVLSLSHLPSFSLSFSFSTCLFYTISILLASILSTLPVVSAVFLFIIFSLSFFPVFVNTFFTSFFLQKMLCNFWFASFLHIVFVLLGCEKKLRLALLKFRLKMLTVQKARLRFSTKFCLAILFSFHNPMCMFFLLQALLRFSQRCLTTQKTIILKTISTC